ncbi:conserved Plasmodium protein, unknown function [Plasmodium knowlesi strain H]|uniref:Uncharacterized protein n=3 Tax=Plasmodium knowlesi TaxID=5850 RepID=A0A5K1TWG6_PLAKH|nr:conserved protein, unknown function [Plasmodium knowlesi strain H]OTN65506.1 Uncharacterized protein PKNOH_S110103400 [Plasmodium knowlesi]CAA9989653.1 conserved protein, unknown function [Plasmodium knowlesi strain H]SBO22764.1 conserved Plasmodium protein, unknown function [Plasmodium knowlesi strain H]SBO23135.1 conserved Plasmodium protein, unknown function [Plasmodium knowlesi strain H]VVS79127.1 conserved protein, unknown function [Plasmodium knowlesi strain H]|eukprot:XP_002260377.1 hypothetical protein, conserved in Plasmodium species [Plasmodium knowlesi strain H]
MASTPEKSGKAGEKEAEMRTLNISNNTKHDLSNDESYQKLKEDKKRMKKELLIKDSEIKSLRKLLEEREKDTKINYIPLNEARKITYKALRKGSAAQKFIYLIESNSINYKLKKRAINQLVLNAFGVMHHQKNRYPEILKYTDSHLKLFRQEQLILLAENERLTLQMKELKKQLLDNKIEILKKNEKNLIMSMRKGVKEISSAAGGAGPRGTALDEDEDNYVELDADIVEKNFINLIKNFKIAQLKLQFYAFRKLSNNLYYNADPINISATMSSSLKRGVDILSSILRYKKRTSTCAAFYKLLTHNDNNFVYNNRRYSEQSHMSPFVNPTCFMQNDNKKIGEGISNYVFKPYYYDNLPSATYDMRRKKCSLQKLKKNCIMKNLVTDGDNQYRVSNAECETIHDPFSREHRMNACHADMNEHTHEDNTNGTNRRIYKNRYFGLGINKNHNDDFEKRTYSSDLDFDYLAEFSNYDREKFIDMFISETSKR